MSEPHEKGVANCLGPESGVGDCAVAGDIVVVDTGSTDRTHNRPADCVLARHVNPS
jgi:hypothetical protein